ncbi:unnamed protein product, partial [Ilex paraguariensis]
MGGAELFGKQGQHIQHTMEEMDYVPEDIESIFDYAKEPPLVPPHLQMTLLNVPSSHMEIPPPFSRPQHVVVNHLYMQKGRSCPSVVALGSTHRFLAKNVTVLERRQQEETLM